LQISLLQKSNCKKVETDLCGVVRYNKTQKLVNRSSDYKNW